MRTKLKQYADILQKIRHFFSLRDVLEVQTKLLRTATVTDIYIDSISAQVSGKTHYLQTSPEYAMKILLANGSDDIFQICKAFRQDELGRLHKPEFTMLEWYRLGFDHHQLMDEMDELLQLILGLGPAECFSYQAIFEKHLEFNPHEVDLKTLLDSAKQYDLLNTLGRDHDNQDDWLMLLMSHIIEPNLGLEQPCFIYDYPKSQAALAKINGQVASRFEVYVKGIELANGFHELQDANEQKRRFEKDLSIRKTLGKDTPPIDEDFIAALEKGLPDCSGVALGVDRLVMLALGKNAV